MTKAQVVKEGFFPLFIVFSLILSCIILGYNISSERSMIELTSRDISVFAMVVIGGSTVISLFTLHLLNMLLRN